MNNYRQIQDGNEYNESWTAEEQNKFPHLFDWTTRIMKEGLKAGEKVN